MKLDLARLRQAAQAATSGPWARVEAPWDDGSWVATGTGDPHGQAMICDCDPWGEREEDGHDHPHLALAEDDAAFIAEWNPQVALALLARLEAAEAAAARAAPTADVVYVLDVADNDYGAQGKPIAVYSTRAAAEAYLRLPRRGYAGVMEVPFNPPVPPR